MHCFKLYAQKWPLYPLLMLISMFYLDPLLRDFDIMIINLNGQEPNFRIGLCLAHAHVLYLLLQFSCRCFQICIAYGYSVEFSGVGDPPSVSKINLGHCSQIAVFRLIHQSPRTMNLDTPFQIVSYLCTNSFNIILQVSECSHPYEENPLSRTEKLCREAEYYLRVLLRRRLTEEEQDDFVMSIRLDDLLVFPQVKRLCSSVQDIE